MLTDYHLHLERDEKTADCRFNAQRVAQYVAAARAAGLVEIGISEHCYRFSEFRPLFAPLLAPQLVAGGWWLPDNFNYSLDRYVAQVQAAMSPAADQGVTVRLGLEADYFPGREADIEALLKNHPWDYVIGSVHFLPGWAIDVKADEGWPGRNIDQAYRDYFATLTKAAASGLFDILAHPDLIKKFGHRPTFDLTPLYEQVAQACITSGTTVEISTAGWHVPVEEVYPAPEFLAVLAQAGVPVSLGSDAHQPEHVGRDLSRATALAKTYGYRQQAVFHRRRRSFRPL